MGVVQILSKLLVLPLQAVGIETRPARANRVSPVLNSPWEGDQGVGDSWMPLSYGEYHPRSALVYSAIKVRQDAVSGVPLRVHKRLENVTARGIGNGVYRGETATDQPSPSELRPRWPGVSGQSSRERLEAAGPEHPVQWLLDSPNPFWTRGGLWRATETYLGLWGSAFWGLERDELGRVVEIWPLMSDRMRVVPDAVRYIKGYVYVGQGRQLVSYVPEDIVWLRYFNPLDEYAGLSPIAPL